METKQIYSIRLYYSTYVDLNVEAETKEDAIDIAFGVVNNNNVDPELLANMENVDVECYIQK